MKKNTFFKSTRLRVIGNFYELIILIILIFLRQKILYKFIDTRVCTNIHIRIQIREFFSTEEVSQGQADEDDSPARIC